MHLIRQQRLRHGDSQGASQQMAALSVIFHLPDGLQNRVDIRQQPFPGLSQLHPPSDFFKQLDRQFLLQQLHLQGDGGLGVIQPLRRFLKTAGLENGFEGG